MFDEQICKMTKTYSNTKTIADVLSNYYCMRHDLVNLAAYIRMGNPEDPEYREWMKKEIKTLADICNGALKELEE